MTRKCSVAGCTTNYRQDKDPKNRVYMFPKDSEKRSQWIASLPNVITHVTTNMGICSKHWPTDVPMQRSWRSKLLIPKDPPSVFPGCLATMTRQTVAKKSRDVSQRHVSFETRSIIPDEIHAFQLQDSVPEWSLFSKEVPLRYPHLLFRKDENVRIFDVNLKSPPSVVYSVTITESFHVTAFNGFTQVGIKDLLGFSHQLYKWSQLDEIINRTKHAAPEMKSEVDGILARLDSLIGHHDVDPNSFTFLLEQLRQSITSPSGRRFSSHTTHYATQLFISSRNAYRVASTYLSLPSARTLYQHIGRVCEIAHDSECDQTIAAAFSAFNGLQKDCFILFDEMYVKPSIRYRGGHVFGQAVDEPQEAARTVLAIMVQPMMGAPAFVCRLIPMHKLSAVFLHCTITSVIESIHRHSGRVLGLMADNHPTNRSCYAMFSADPPDEKWMGINPVDGSLLYLLIDPVHLMKSVRNNWLSEKSRHLKINFNGVECLGKWSDICAIFEKERSNVVKRTSLTHEACYPNNLELQKVSLFNLVFNEKNVVALKLDGLQSTATLLDYFSRLWKILNIKSPESHFYLNDPDRRPFRNTDDPRLVFLESMADAIGNMKGGKGPNRIASLTSETRDALASTIRGLIHLWKRLLSVGYIYVLPGVFQSDRLEGEFGIYRQLSGGNYFISMEQVASSLRLQRLKLYDRLKIKGSSHVQSPCCSKDFNDVELDIVDQAMMDFPSGTEEEHASLFYICGYIAKTVPSVPNGSIFDCIPPESEFTNNLNRGLLTLPCIELFHFSKMAYFVFSHLTQLPDFPLCSVRVQKLLMILLSSTPFDFEENEKVCRKLTNTFYKGLMQQRNTLLIPRNPNAAANERRKRKLSAT